MITMKELQDKIGGVFYFATVENGEPLWIYHGV